MTYVTLTPTPHPGRVFPMTATQIPYTPLPAAALDIAVQARRDGHTFPAILRSLTANGWETTGYDGGLLNHHVRRRCADLGIPVPGATTRPATRRTRRTGARRFGVEIEVVGLGQAAAATALRNAGLNAEVESYNHRTRSHWKVVTDATVRGCEVVSPPMTDWADVATAMAALRAAGGTVDRTTGLHIHHEVADLDGASLARLVRMYADHATEIDGLVAPSRRGSAGRWCAPVARMATQFEQAFLQVTGTTTRERQAQAAALGYGRRDDNRRYHTVNVFSYVAYGTVEFRQHQGTLSGAKGEAWLLLGQAMIRAAVEARTFPTGGLVSGLAAAGCLSEAPAAFLSRRAAALATA